MSQLTLADCWPRRFSPSSLALQFCEDPTQAEQPLFAKASAGEAVAQLWQAPQGLVVPGSYRQFTDLPAVSAHFAARGWRYGFAAPAAVWCPRGRALSTLASPGRCSSRSAKPPNRSIIRCALCCSAPSRASALPATPGR
ncbi:Lipoate-protein ligase A [Klebsiella pneumoniae subsp. pneumoniae ST258-K28BO]|nr:Lipoate-protein ligase A [Klebsiella pneumoniae subsp. pneumoniae ST258-K28BO]